MASRVTVDQSARTTETHTTSTSILFTGTIYYRLDTVYSSAGAETLLASKLSHSFWTRAPFPTVWTVDVPFQ